MTRETDTHPRADAPPGADPEKDAGGGTASRPSPASTPASEDDVETLRKRASERDDLLEKLQRTAAEFANYQKRIQREIKDSARFSLQTFVTEVLPVLDNLTRARLSAERSREFDKLLEGVTLVERLFEKILADNEVKPIAAEGKPFDPAVHEAVASEPRGDLPERTVVAEVRRGYKLHDRVIRPSQVRIAMGQDKPGGADPKDSN